MEPISPVTQQKETLHDISQKSLGGLMQKALSFLERQATESERGAIIVKDGIFTINENMEMSSIKVDPKLKSLIDSVIHRP